MKPIPYHQFAKHYLSLVLWGIVTMALLMPTDFAQAQTPSNMVNVTVDFAQPVAVKSMSGVIHGMSDNAPGDNLVQPLRPRLWRLGGMEDPLYNRVIRFGARPQLVLSDTYGYPFQNWHGKKAPYQDWTAWENHVRQIARRYKNKNLLWDVWNEPDGIFWNGSREQFFETYVRAYRVLRQELGPAALIGGPSLDSYEKDYIAQFLDYALAKGAEVNFLSWHELIEADTNIPGVTDHLVDARRSFVNNPKYQNLRIREIQINEFVGPQSQNRPGAIYGFLKSLELGGADAAAKACWGHFEGWSDNCFNDSLGGILHPNNKATLPGWWAYKTYADGAGYRVNSTSSDRRVAVLASRPLQRAATGQVLIGFYEFHQTPPSVPVKITVNHISRLGFPGVPRQARARLERIPAAGDNPVPGMSVLSDITVPVNNDSVQLILPRVNLHEGYVLTLMPVSSTR